MKVISILYDGVLIRINEDSARLDWHWPHTPLGMVKYTPRKGSNQWHYVYFGQHDETCLTLANQYVVKNIEKLQKELDTLKSDLITKENVLKQHGVVK